MINLIAALNDKEIGQACAEFALRKHGYSVASKAKPYFSYNADDEKLVAAIAFDGELTLDDAVVQPLAAAEPPR